MGKVLSIDKKETSEKNEKELRLLQRWTVSGDEDGHQYLLPIQKLIEFEQWVETMSVGDEDEMDDADPNRYDAYRLEGGRLTFTDPTVD